MPYMVPYMAYDCHLSFRPDVVKDWEIVAKEYHHSDNWQKLHAVWLGLCQKVSDGSLKQNRAHKMFEEERGRIKRLEKRRLTTPIGNPFG